MTTAHAVPDGFAGDLVTADGFPFALTRPALEKASSLADTTAGPVALRLAVAAGGCSGLRYQLYFDNAVSDRDTVGELDGFTVVCDTMSAPYLNGATVHFVETIEKMGFVIENPNAAGSCACGDSFN
jgi:iron-sulfur cluster assembly accessory protein